MPRKVKAQAGEWTPVEYVTVTDVRASIVDDTGHRWTAKGVTRAEAYQSLLERIERARLPSAKRLLGRMEGYPKDEPKPSAQLALPQRYEDLSPEAKKWIAYSEGLDTDPRTWTVYRKHARYRDAYDAGIEAGLTSGIATEAAGEAMAYPHREIEDIVREYEEGTE